jgi:hypothetical protein
VSRASDVALLAAFLKAGVDESKVAELAKLMVEREKMGDKKRCGGCGGTGNCSRCGGSGFDADDMRHGNAMPCKKCLGARHCPDCGGSGEER